MLNDTVDRLLGECMEREKKVLLDHNGVEHKVFFRRSRDKNSTTDYLTMFHRADSGIETGMELRFAGGDPDTVLLVINSENIESEIYRRSDCIKCNAFVDFCSKESGYDEKGDRVTVATVFDANVPVFLSSGADSVLLAIKADDVRFVCSGRHGISSDNAIAVIGLQEGKNHTFTQRKNYYSPSIIDYANFRSKSDGTSGGLLTIAAKIDISYPNS